MSKKIHLLIIDPQVDFCDPTGALFVQGADKDMERLGKFIDANHHRISEIHCTLDSHQVIHIAHPIFWVNSKGENPTKFTLISAADVRNGTWRAFHPALQARAQAYVDTLKANGRYVLCIWPPHCLIGTKGHSVYPAVSDALIQWETKTISRVNYITKGSNFLTEHYSAVMADVPDDADPTTKLNTALIDTLQEADEIWVGAEALSHCVANTVTDIADNFGDDNIKKIVLLEDASSNVTGFEQMGIDFIKKMTARGMRIAKTTTL
jgi:nicotinamidase/pyrazinamidase